MPRELRDATDASRTPVATAVWRVACFDAPALEQHLLDPMTTTQFNGPAAEPAHAERWFFDVWSVFYDQPLVQRLTYRPVHEAVLRALRRREPGALLDL